MNLGEKTLLAMGLPIRPGSHLDKHSRSGPLVQVAQQVVSAIGRVLTRRPTGLQASAHRCAPQASPRSQCRIRGEAVWRDLRLSGNVVAIQVHDFAPCRDEVVNELLMSVRAAVDLGEGAKLRIRADH